MYVYNKKRVLKREGKNQRVVSFMKKNSGGRNVCTSGRERENERQRAQKCKMRRCKNSFFRVSSSLYVAAATAVVAEGERISEKCEKIKLIRDE